MSRFTSIFTRLFTNDAKNPVNLVKKMNEALDEVSSALQGMSSESDTLTDSINGLSQSITNLTNLLNDRFFSGDDYPFIIGVKLIDKNEVPVYVWPEVGTDGITSLIWDTTKP